MYFKMETKKCSKCKLDKNLSDFYIEKRTNKERSECKSCGIDDNKSRKKYSRKLDVLFKTCNTCKEVKTSSEFSDNYLIKDGISNICKTCCVSKSKIYYENNKESVDKYRKNYNIEHKEDISLYNLKYKPIKLAKAKEARIKHTLDDVSKFKKNTRNLILDSFKRVCNGTYKKSDRTENILGCTIEEFIGYIENLFEDGMSFENHGKCIIGDCNVWHIDHKIPLSSAKTEEDIIKLCHYTNLQPLWAINNLRKGNRINN